MTTTIKKGDKSPQIPPEYKDLIGEYVKAYPGVRTFYVTGDHLVFLPSQKAAAEAHQKGIASGKVTTIKI